VSNFEHRAPGESLPPEYFEARYAANPDPWSFETSPYEAAKYAATLEALPRRTYRSALEIGCSIGVLTERLAPRCADLLAVDVSDRALRRAAERCRHLPQVRFARLSVPREFPHGPFDLVLVSEVGYYWSRADLALARRRVAGALEPGGSLLLVHWTPFVDDYPLTGDEVHEAFLASAGPGSGLRHLLGQRHESYRLDLFERTDGSRPRPELA
jgi:SAM-dependent methyltransferase